MKLTELLRATEKRNRGGVYYETGSFLEAVFVGFLFGIAVSMYQLIDNPLIGLLAFASIIAMVTLLPKKFPGFKRCMIFAPADTDPRYSTLVFSLFYFILVSGTASFVLYIVNTYVKF